MNCKLITTKDCKLQSRKMKHLIIFILLFTTAMQTTIYSQTANFDLAKEQSDLLKQSEEKKNLLNEMETNFLNGAINGLNTEGMRKLFHPDFAILIANGEKLNRLPLNIWINVIEEYKATPEKKNSGVRDNIDHKYDIIDITGNAAMIKVQLFRQNTLITTDYVSLLKFSDGWKIVAKISNEHIPNPFNL